MTNTNIFLEIGRAYAEKILFQQALEAAINGSYDFAAAKKGKKPNCTAKSHFCQTPNGRGSCVTLNKPCKYKPDGALATAANAVGRGKSKGKADQSSQSKTKPSVAGTVDQAPLGPPIKESDLGVTSYSDVGNLFRGHSPGEIETDASPDPKLVAAFQRGETNLTLAFVYDDGDRAVAADPESAKLIASAAAAGKRLNTMNLGFNPSSSVDPGNVAAEMIANSKIQMGKVERQKRSTSDVGNLLQLDSDQISGGETSLSQSKIDQIAQTIRSQNTRAWLPVAVREVDTDRYEVVGDGTPLAIARRANVRPWVYVVED